MPKVFVVQPPTSRQNDLSALAPFGDVSFLLEPYYQPSLEPERALAEMRNGLKGFKEGDYITSLAGDLAGTFMAGLLLPDYSEGPVRWLRWERDRDQFGIRQRSGKYVETPFTY